MSVFITALYLHILIYHKGSIEIWQTENLVFVNVEEEVICLAQTLMCQQIIMCAPNTPIYLCKGYG